MIFINIDQELSDIINLFLNKSEVRAGNKNKLFHTASITNSVYFSCSLLKLKKTFNISKRDVIKILLSRKRESSLFQIDKEFIIRKSLNGAILINFTDKRVIKFAKKYFEPNFIQNEIKAQELLPRNTPKILDYGENGSYYFIVADYREKNKNVDWLDWSNELIKISPILDEFCKNNKLVTIKSDDYVLETLRNLDSAIENKKYLIVEFEEIVFLLKKCFEDFQHEKLLLYKIFSHGDLVPNNVIETADDTYICDWTNGGLHNIFYDAMMQYFYFSQNELWEKFNIINFDNNDLPCCERLNYFIDLYKKNYKLSFTDNQIKLSLLISLSEVGLKNFLRHQSAEEFLEGESLLSLIREICNNILKSK